MAGRKARATGSDLAPLQAGIDVYLNELDGLKAEVLMTLGQQGDIDTYFGEADLKEQMEAVRAEIAKAEQALGAATVEMKTARAKAWLIHNDNEDDS